MPNESIIDPVSGKNTAGYLKSLIEFVNKKVTNQLVLHGVGELLAELDYMLKSLHPGNSS